MADLTPEILTSVLQVSRSRAGEIAEALARGLDLNVKVQVSSPIVREDLPESPEFDSPGLVVVLTLGKTSAVLVLSETTGLLPEWYSEPDLTGRSRLKTMAQELGMLLLPDECMPDEFAAGHVANLSTALQRGQLADTVVYLPLELQRSTGDSVKATLIWPLGRGQAVLSDAVRSAAPVEAEAPRVVPPPQPPPQQQSFPNPGKGAADPAEESFSFGTTLQGLPPYAKSLLRIRVPVVVTLAHKRQRLSRILEMGPGSILQFDKSCEDMLELEVGDHPVALGEAIKVGDKFGLRVNTMILPDERFRPVRKAPGR